MNLYIYRLILGIATPESRETQQILSELKPLVLDEDRRRRLDREQS